MDRISNYDTNKFVYLVVHLINFLTKINIILKTKTKINNFIQKKVAYTKKKKKKKIAYTKRRRRRRRRKKNPCTISIRELI